MLLPSPYGGFAYGWSEANPDSEQIEPAGAELHRRNSASVEQIQDRRGIEGEGAASCHPELGSGSIHLMENEPTGIDRFRNKFGMTDGYCERKKTAFTLAEVLITLGIIGVVAALTLPILTQNYRRQEASARLKKFNSTMYQAVLLSEQDNGPSENWITVGVNNIKDIKMFFETYLAPYIKYSKADFTSSVEAGSNGRDSYYVYFNDGSAFRFSKGNCLDFYFDINGDGKPNEFGKDKFIFLLCGGDAANMWCNGRHWCPYYRSSSASNLRQGRLNNCKADPAYCSGLLEYDNWEFKSDYPYRL